MSLQRCRIIGGIFSWIAAYPHSFFLDPCANFGIHYFRYADPNQRASNNENDPVEVDTERLEPLLLHALYTSDEMVGVFGRVKASEIIKGAQGLQGFLYN